MKTFLKIGLFVSICFGLFLFTKADFVKQLIFNEKKATTADEKATTVIHIEIGGYHSGYPEVTITKQDSGALIHYIPSAIADDQTPIKKQLNQEEWDKFVLQLYLCNITNWKKRYDNINALDGTQWSLDVTRKDMPPINTSGSNLYPPEWEQFLKVINLFGLPEMR